MGLTRNDISRIMAVGVISIVVLVVVPYPEGILSFSLLDLVVGSTAARIIFYAALVLAGMIAIIVDVFGGRYLDRYLPRRSQKR